MGCPGYGIDSFYRLLKYYIDRIKPEMLVMSYPWQSTRTEVYDHNYDMWESVTINKESRSKLDGFILQHLTLGGIKRLMQLSGYAIIMIVSYMLSRKTNLTTNILWT